MTVGGGDLGGQGEGEEMGEGRKVGMMTRVERRERREGGEEYRSALLKD